MSKYCAIVDGKVLDYRFKKLPTNYNLYAFYVGDIYVGQLSSCKRRGWSAVSSQPCDLCPVSGFISRMSACQFLLKIIKVEDAYNSRQC